MKKLIYMTFIALLTGCAIQTKTYQKPDAAIAKKETWCWMQGCEVIYQGPEEYYNEEALALVSDAIAEQMAKKGYIRNDDDPDLLVNFFMIVEMKEQQVVEPHYGGGEVEMRWLPEVYPEYIHYLKGSLVIDVIDRKASELLWRGNAIKYMEIYPKLDEESINKGVFRAMKRLPERKY
jgi:hypothetical protein